MNIALVMLLKGVILGIWAILSESWLAYRKRRMSNGLELRYNRRTGTHTVRDWTETFERFLVATRKFAIGLVFVWWIVIGFYLIAAQ